MFRPFEAFIGSRYIRARHGSQFVSFISLIAMVGIAVGVAALIAVLAVMNGFETELRERILTLTSHATLEGIDGGISDWEEVMRVANERQDVTGSAPFVEGRGIITRDETLSAALLRGILPEAESNVTSLAESVTDGSLSALAPGEFSLVVGTRLADVLGVGVGDDVIVAIPQGNVTPAGLVPRMRRFEIVGIFEADMYEYDRGLAFMHMDDAARLFRVSEGAAGVRIAVTDLFRAPTTIRELAVGLGGGYYISDWTRLHANFFRSVRLTRTVMLVILLIVVGVATFNIVSLLIMVVKDKRGDIAILRTLGVGPRSVMTMFVVQGSLLGMIGTLLGVVGGVVLAFNMEAIVAWLERVFATELVRADVYFVSKLPADIRPVEIGIIVLVAFVMVLLSTLYPAWRAARTEPAEVLRYE